MRLTEEMINEDEKRWHARDIVTELGYCGNYMRDRKDMKNIDIRFYAYIMRKAHAMLKEQEAIQVDTKVIGTFNGDMEVYCCRNCRTILDPAFHYCPNCGHEVKWD